MMNETLDKWVRALESGDYEQGRGFLRNSEDEYCCLGVLCDIVDPDGWDETEDFADGNLWYEHLGYEDVASKAIFDQLGPVDFTQAELVLMNDEDDKTFLDIASFIRDRSE